MFDVLNYIKDHDVSVRPKLVPNYPTFVPMYSGQHFANGPVSEPGYIIRPHMENLNLGSGLGTHDSYPSPIDVQYRIAEGLKTKDAGEDFFRSTNVFSQGNKY
jgi:hypothetical protein